MRISGIFAAAALSAAALLPFASCGTTDAARSAYYENNIGDFSEESLSNGIPVAFKRNSGSQIAVVRLIFEGGTSVLPPSAGGLEEMTLDLMLHGSKGYPYQTIQRLTFDKSFAFTHSGGREFATAGLTCIKRDLHEALEILADGVLNPLFLEKDFAQSLKLAEDGVQSAKTSPEGVLSETISAALFDGHPYRTSTNATEGSLPSLTLSAVRAHHAELLDAARMKIVVVANLEDDEKAELLRKLDGAFGGIAAGTFARAEIPPIPVGGATVRAECEAAGETGYIEGIYACPDRADADYVPFALATMFVDDSLFRIVRERNGAVYSVGTGVLGASRFAGAVSLFKATKFDGLGGIVREALADFPGTEKEIERKLDHQKNKFITQVFDNARTAGGIASNMTASWIYRGSPSAYLLRPSEVESVTAAQVMEAYRKYVRPAAEGKIRWIVVGGKGAAQRFELD